MPFEFQIYFLIFEKPLFEGICWYLSELTIFLKAHMNLKHYTKSIIPKSRNRFKPDLFLQELKKVAFPTFKQRKLHFAVVRCCTQTK